MNLSFKNQVALVTGGDSGIGWATAKAFAESGAAVVLSSWREEKLRARAEELESAGHKALAVSCDVSIESQVQEMVEKAVPHQNMQ